jgi:hypothetical protein
MVQFSQLQETTQRLLYLRFFWALAMPSLLKSSESLSQQAEQLNESLLKLTQDWQDYERNKSLQMQGVDISKDSMDA